MTGSSRKWYLTHTDAHVAVRVVADLRSRDLEVHQSVLRSGRLRAGVHDMMRPPRRYCSVAFDIPHQRSCAIRSTLSCNRLTETVDGSIAMRPDTVSGLRAHEYRVGCVIKNAQIRSCFGATARSTGNLPIVSSTLFEGLTGQNRTAVLIDSVGGHVRMGSNMQTMAA